MTTKRELLSKLLDNQLELVAILHGDLSYLFTAEKAQQLSSVELLNAIRGVEALVNAIAALPLTTEEKAQKRDRASNKAVEQCSVQDALSGWQAASDKIPLNREPTHSYDDDDAGW